MSKVDVATADTVTVVVGHESACVGMSVFGEHSNIVEVSFYMDNCTALVKLANGKSRLVIVRLEAMEQFANAILVGIKRAKSIVVDNHLGQIEQNTDRAK